MGVGESPFFMAEQFAFEECLGNCSAIHGDEGLESAFALVVYLPRDDFFASPVFSQEQYRKIRVTNSCDGGFQL